MSLHTRRDNDALQDSGNVNLLSNVIGMFLNRHCIVTGQREEIYLMNGYT
jgi:hypothetical protein